MVLYMEIKVVFTARAKIFDTEEFGYQKIVVEQPREMKVEKLY